MRRLGGSRGEGPEPASRLALACVGWGGSDVFRFRRTSGSPAAPPRATTRRRAQSLGTKQPRPGRLAGRRRDVRWPSLQLVHLHLPVRRPQPHRPLGHEARRAGGDPRRVSAGFDIRSGHSDLRALAASGGTHGPAVPGALDGTSHASPRAGVQRNVLRSPVLRSARDRPGQSRGLAVALGDHDALFSAASGAAAGRGAALVLAVCRPRQAHRRSDGRADGRSLQPVPGHRRSQLRQIRGRRNATGRRRAGGPGRCPARTAARAGGGSAGAAGRRAHGRALFTAR